MFLAVPGQHQDGPATEGLGGMKIGQPISHPPTASHVEIQVAFGVAI